MNIILIAAILLLIFPFLGFPELWENIYVGILGFVVGYTLLLLRHRSGIVENHDEEKSLQEYVKEIQTRFKEHEDVHGIHKKTSRISDISIEHE